MAPSRCRVVLVVDDHADTVDLYTNLLEDRGFHCLTASTAEEAVDRVRAVPVGLVILDLGLPRLEDGLELAWRLQAIPDPPRLIAVTGHPPERIPPTPFINVFLKPVEPEALVAAVDAALSGA